MTECTRPPGPALSTTPVVRNIEIDELSDVRYTHASALKAHASGHLTDPELDAFVAYVYSDTYTDRLAEMVRARRLFGVTVDSKLTATAGWMPANDSGATARLLAVFVAPMFAGMGLGRLATLAAEANAVQAGFAACSVRTPVGAVGFFQRLGYDIASYGVWSIRADCSLPVAFMRRTLGKAEPSGTDRQATEECSTNVCASE